MFKTQEGRKVAIRTPLPLTQRYTLTPGTLKAKQYTGKEMACKTGDAHCKTDTV